jgi:hypothetical protein
LEKLHDQLVNASPEAVQLMAELHAVHILIIWTGAISLAKKRSDLEAILSWIPVPCTVPDDVRPPAHRRHPCQPSPAAEHNLGDRLIALAELSEDLTTLLHMLDALVVKTPASKPSPAASAEKERSIVLAGQRLERTAEPRLLRRLQLDGRQLNPNLTIGVQYRAEIAPPPRLRGFSADATHGVPPGRFRLTER